MRYGNKYKNHKVLFDEIVFDSKKEANRYKELSLLASKGEIQNLERQVKYQLIPSQKVKGQRQRQAVHYIADFRYARDGEVIVEDVKGFKTDTYQIKKKLMMWVHGIEVHEI